MRIAMFLAFSLLWAVMSLVAGQARVVITGSSTGRGANSRSEVACPAGLVAVECRCDNYAYCNGAYITNGRCRVVISTMGVVRRILSSSARLKPVITCEPEYTRIYMRRSGTPVNRPEASCDEGSILTGCSIYSGLSSTSTSSSFPKPVISGNTCKSSKTVIRQMAYVICRDLKNTDPRLIVNLEETKVVVGAATPARDHAASTAQCPDGMVPIDCQCDNWENCNGAYVTSDMKCRVQNSDDNKPVKPVVACSREYTRVSYKNSEVQDRPQVSCEAGSILVGCSIYSYSKDSGTRPTISGNTCKSSATNPGTKAYVICRDETDRDPRLLVSLQDTEVIVGSATAARDGASSTVACPAGKVPVNCQCDDWQNCDGAYITDDKKCKVYASAARKAVKPVVACAHEYTSVVYKSSGASSRPQVSCDAGSTLVGCSIYSGARSASNVPVVAGNTCKTSGSSQNTKAYAICRELTDECISGEGETFPYGPCSVSCGDGEKSRVYYCTTSNMGASRFVHETVACSGPPCSGNN